LILRITLGDDEAKLSQPYVLGLPILQVLCKLAVDYGQHFVAEFDALFQLGLGQVPAFLTIDGEGLFLDQSTIQIFLLLSRVPGTRFKALLKVPSTSVQMLCTVRDILFSDLTYFCSDELVRAWLKLSDLWIKLPDAMTPGKIFATLRNAAA
jgi:hypothetical protein